MSIVNVGFLVVRNNRAVSSVGRASRLHRGGHRFESYTAHQVSKVGV